MAKLNKTSPQVPVVLISLVFWASFAWGLPAEAAGSESEAKAAVEDPWAGVRVSDAYDYAKCPQCGKKNELRAQRCSRCDYEFPQPSAEMSDPAWVFVPGRGYHREGTLLEPGKNRKGMLIAGIVLMSSGVIALPVMVAVTAQSTGEIGYPTVPAIGAINALGLGAVLLVVSLSTRKKPVYAFADGQHFQLNKRPAFALGSPGAEGVALKVEVTALSF
jgi:predicted RNA-binding Zn-ribbon protein involved in translation (DUF1610 family)